MKLTVGFRENQSSYTVLLLSEYDSFMLCEMTLIRPTQVTILTTDENKPSLYMVTSERNMVHSLRRWLSDTVDDISDIDKIDICDIDELFMEYPYIPNPVSTYDGFDSNGHNKDISKLIDFMEDVLNNPELSVTLRNKFISTNK